MSEVKMWIGCTQRFDIEVTPALVDLLTKSGQMHYDGVCKDAVRAGRGGFIYGWSNRLEGRRLLGETDPVIDGITNRQLQTCLKIFEMPLPPGSTPEEERLRGEFTRMGFAALRQGDADPRFQLDIPVVKD